MKGRNEMTDSNTYRKMMITYDKAMEKLRIEQHLKKEGWWRAHLLEKSKGHFHGSVRI